MRGASKIIAINIAILMAMLFSANLVCFLLIAAYNKVKYDFGQAATDPRAELPAYADKALSRQIFIDQRSIPVRFRSYIEWRREPHATPTTNIDSQGRRYVPGQTVGGASKTIGLYGGSTIWGTGVEDTATIPARLQALIPGSSVLNEGESGYLSRNGLDRLINAANQKQLPEVVVFYDGVNEVEHQCEDGARINKHHFEDPINEGLARKPLKDERDLIGMGSRILDILFLENLRDMAARLVKRSRMAAGWSEPAPAGDWLCAGNPEYTDQVAEALLQNWQIAHAITLAGGSKFVAVLQPTAFVGPHRLDHLKLPPQQAEQYRAVYAAVRRKLSERNYPWVVDLVAVLDEMKDQALFIDFCHVNQTGNDAVARALAKIVEPLTR